MRARAKRINRPDSGFLFELAADEIAGRLAATNREFKSAALLLCESKSLAGKLAELHPDIAITEFGLDDFLAGNETALEEILGAGSRDLVLSVFGLHWMNDLPGMLTRIRRALRPDGLFMAALPGDGSFQELRQSLIEAESALSGGASLRIGPFAEVRSLGALLQRAGFALPVADADRLMLRYPGMNGLVGELRAAGLTNAIVGTQLTLSRRAFAMAGELYAMKFGDADGRVRATVNMAYLTGWAPHESQQQPLKPGSAKFSMKQALAGRDRA
jgi:SAM-dependent methyltransferase